MTSPISPKVTASAVTSVLAASLLATVTLITPDLFTGMGKWSGLVYGLVIAVVSTVAGWLKNDPLRNPGTPTVPDTSPATVTAPDLPAPDMPESTPTV